MDTRKKIIRDQIVLHAQFLSLVDILSLMVTKSFPGIKGIFPCCL